MMMTVNELARKADVTTDTVRHYVRIGLLQPERHPDNGYKLFNPADVQRLRFIHQARQLGYSLKEIKAIFFECQQVDTVCPKARKILRRRMKDNRAKLREMNKLQRKLEKEVALWEKKFPDGAPDSDSVWRLIESAP